MKQVDLEKYGLDKTIWCNVWIVPLGQKPWGDSNDGVIMLNSVELTARARPHHGEIDAIIENCTPISYDDEESRIIRKHLTDASLEADRERHAKAELKAKVANADRLYNLYHELYGNRGAYDGPHIIATLEEILIWRNNFLSITQPTEAKRSTDVYNTGDDVFIKWFEFRERHNEVFGEDK